MKIVKAVPPIWQAIVAAGMHPIFATTVVTYGDTLYVPSGNEVPDHLMCHEETHSEQQGENPDAWWSRYLDDPYFRIDQEAEAYAVQYAFICQAVHDRNKRYKILSDLARGLASPTYGSVIGSEAAKQQILKIYQQIIK